MPDLNSVTENKELELASATNPYTAVGFQVLKILQGFNILQGKTKHLEWKNADSLSVGLSNFCIQFETNQGNYDKANNMSDEFLGYIIAEISPNTAWTNQKEEILGDYEKLRAGNINVGKEEKFRFIVQRLFLWIFLNLDVTKKETFTQFPSSIYNRVIVDVANNNGVKLSYLTNELKYNKSNSNPSTNSISGFFNDVVNTITGNKDNSESNNSQNDSGNIYLFLGIGLFVIILVAIIFRSFNK